jgi:hypothetical protein
MNASVVGTFAPVLREVERGLALPIPDRIRILRELESDLEELMDRLVDEGFPPEEARTLALEALVPNAETLKALGDLHSPLYRQLTRHLSTGRVRKAERYALGLSTAGVLLVQTVTLLRADLLQDPSPFLVPVLLTGAFLSALVFWKAFRFWIKKDHISPGRGLGAILGISGTVLALGFGGLIFDFYRLAVVLERSPELAQTLVAVWLMRDAALLSVAIILAMAGGLAWFVLSQWLTRVSGARRDLLGLGSAAQLEGEEYNVR